MNDAHDFIERQTILIVDDTPDNITLLSALLKDRYKIKVATQGERALKIAAADPPPDLILLDIMMPGMDGYEVCRRLKAEPRTAEIPVIFLTAKVQVEDEEKGLKLGAVDYITKPISPPIVLARVETHLTLKNARQFLKDRNAFLEAEVQRRTREVAAIQDVTILAMASLAETRDNETGNHIRRTQHYVRALAQKTAIASPVRACPQRRDHRPAVQVSAAARHRQGGHSRPDSAQAGGLHPRGIRDHENPRRSGPRRDSGRRKVSERPPLVPALRPGDRLFPPGALGRQRLSRRVGGRCHSRFGAADGGGGRVRRADQPAGVQGRDATRTGGGDDCGRPGHALRSGHRGRLSGHRR